MDLEALAFYLFGAVLLAFLAMHAKKMLYGKCGSCPLKRGCGKH